MIRRLFNIVLPIAILAAALIGAGVLKATRPQVEPKPAQERVWTVATVPATPADVRPELQLFGEIVAGREVELRPLVAGRVIEVGPNFVEGGVVRAGELLVAIDPFDYNANIAEFEARLAESRAQLAEIKAQLTAAQALLEGDREQMALNRRQVERRETLRGSPASSEKALDEAKLQLSQSAQQAIARQESIDRLTAQATQQDAVIRRWQVSLDRSHRELEDTRLGAPFDGFLVDTDVAVGKRVGVGDRIARLIDAGRLEAHFHLSDTEFARLLAESGYRGRPARVVWRVGARAFEYEATIERAESEIDPESGGVDLYATIRDSEVEGVLRPGAFVEVRVPDQLYRDVIRLPESALHDDRMVYVVVDGRLEPREVEVVVRSGSELLVRGKNIATDANVVSTRFPEIGPGIRVTVR